MSFTVERRQEYLDRIGHSGATRPDLDSLRSLHRAQLLAVPFENLDIHLGRAIELDIDAIVRKIVADRRGGFCYELNGAFAALFSSIGFEVVMLEARVYGGGGVGIHFDHLCLAVTIGSERYLADVGFGAFCDAPLGFDDRADQIDPAGTFRIADRDDGWLDTFANDTLAYRLAPVPRAFADFQPGCTYHQTSPDSHFTQGTVCSLRTPDGRVTLSGTTLIETADGERHTRELTPAEVGPVLAERFGVVLPAADIATLT